MRSGPSRSVITDSRRADGLASRTVSRRPSQLPNATLIGLVVVDLLPVATEMAGVDMRLEVGAVRSVNMNGAHPNTV